MTTPGEVENGSASRILFRAGMTKTKATKELAPAKKTSTRRPPRQWLYLLDRCERSTSEPPRRCEDSTSQREKGLPWFSSNKRRERDDGLYRLGACSLGCTVANEGFDPFSFRFGGVFFEWEWRKKGSGSHLPVVPLRRLATVRYGEILDTRQREKDLREVSFAFVRDATTRADPLTYESRVAGDGQTPETPLPTGSW
jgi:hypothetical protein